VDAQQVVEGGGGINECCAGGITVLYWWLSVFLEVMQQELPGFAEVEVFFLHLPRKMEPIEGSETSAFKPQTPGKYPKENILHSRIN